MSIPVLRPATATSPYETGGFRCSRCACGNDCVVDQGARKLLQCNSCRHQASLTAGGRFDLRRLIAEIVVDPALCNPIKEPVIRQHPEARF